MSKRFISIVMCVVMVLGIFPVYAFAEGSLSAWTYKVLNESDKTAEITGYNGTETELVFPEKIDGYTMVAIADYAFEGTSTNFRNITSVTIPETYIRIGHCNFNYYRDLMEINLPHSLTFIGMYSFVGSGAYIENDYNCTRNNEYPVFYIGEYCISCPQYRADEIIYVIKPGTKLIASGAFYHCQYLRGVIIPEGVEYINESAFLSCNFSCLVIPSTVKEIGDYAFIMRYGCFAYIPETVERISDSICEDNEFRSTIYGVKGSEAERVALARNIKFVEIKDILRGDVDGDGILSINDYASMKSNVLCEIEYKGENEIIGDMNGDCVIDGFDLFHVDMAINGMT